MWVSGVTSFGNVYINIVVSVNYVSITIISIIDVSNYDIRKNYANVISIIINDTSIIVTNFIETRIIDTSSMFTPLKLTLLMFTL